MQQKPKHGFISGFLMLTGGVIGAGLFTIPYAMQSIGVIPSIVVLLGTGVMVIILHLILGEVSLSLPGEKTFVGMAKALFPERLAKLTSVTTIFYFFVALIAYIILGGNFIHLLLQGIGISLSPVWGALLYTIVMSVLSLRSSQRGNTIGNYITVFLLICISILLCAGILGTYTIPLHINHRMQSLDMYGIAIFAMSSVGIIPLLYEETGKSAINMRSVILSSGGLITVLCIMFGLAILALSGGKTTADTITGLAQEGGRALGIVGSLVGLFAITTCHIPLSKHLHSILTEDWQRDKPISRMSIFMIPLLIYLYFDPNLISITKTIGAIAGGLLIIFTALMNLYLHTSGKKFKIISMIEEDGMWSWVLLIICSIGVLYEIITLYR